METPPTTDNQADVQLKRFVKPHCRVTVGRLTYCSPSKRQITVAVKERNVAWQQAPARGASIRRAVVATCRRIRALYVS